MSDRVAPSPYSRGPLKRSVDLALTILVLPVALPLGALVAALVLATMGRPILFLQDRIGRGGREFRLYKFRTMRPGTTGLSITGSGDDRVTPAGRWLRMTKLDELPQLMNVLKGDMAIVGPRPEVARFVELYTPEQRQVLEARPGLTDPATLAFRDEERLLGAIPEAERERFYVREVMPRKLRLNLDYLRASSLRRDLVLIVRTLTAILLGKAA